MFYHYFFCSIKHRTLLFVRASLVQHPCITVLQSLTFDDYHTFQYEDSLLWTSRHFSTAIFQFGKMPTCFTKPYPNNPMIMGLLQTFLWSCSFPTSSFFSCQAVIFLLPHFSATSTASFFDVSVLTLATPRFPHKPCFTMPCVREGVGVPYG